MPTLKETPRCCKRVAVDDLGLGQVHLMACGPHMLAAIKSKPNVRSITLSQQDCSIPLPAAATNA